MNDLNELINQFIIAKEKEKLAIEERVKLAEQIANRFEKHEEGNKSHDIEKYKVTVKRTINRTVDWNQFDEISQGKEHIPVKTKRELDEVGLKWIRENDSKYYVELSRAITAKPGRIAIEIKEREND
jgi:hypothetical protein